MNEDSYFKEILDEIGESTELKTIELEDVTEENVSFLVNPYIVKNGINLITAPQKSLKSMIILYLCICTLKGDQFLDHFPTEKINKVLLIDQENRKSAVKNRTIRLGYEPQNITLIDQYIYFDKDEEITNKLISLIKEKEIDLVVIDTLRRTNSNLDENSSRDVNKFFARIQPLKDYATVIIIHHETKPTPMNKNTYYRGSGDIVGAVDSHISLKKGDTNNDSVNLTLKHENARYSQENEPIEIKFNFTDKRFSFTYNGDSKENFIQKLEAEKQERLENLLQFIQDSETEGRNIKEIEEFCKKNFNKGEHTAKEYRDTLLLGGAIQEHTKPSDKKTYFIYTDFAPQQSNIL